MMQESENEINRIWGNLSSGDTFRTPDDSKGVAFFIARIEPDRIFIRPQGVSIYRNAFVAALDYLRANNNDVKNKCEIRSNNDSEKAGPLCQASRKENKNTRCINYIIPILETYRIVDCSGDRPNKVWLRHTYDSYD